jgi:hypothetical protein
MARKRIIKKSGEDRRAQRQPLHADTVLLRLGPKKDKIDAAIQSSQTWD